MYFVSKTNTVVGGSVWAVIIRVVQCATLVYLAQRRRKVQKSVWVTTNWWLFLFSFLYLLNMGGHGPLPPPPLPPPLSHFVWLTSTKTRALLKYMTKKGLALFPIFVLRLRGAVWRSTVQVCRTRRGQLLTDQLTLSQPGWKKMPSTLLLAPLDFLTFLRSYGQKDASSLDLVCETLFFKKLAIQDLFHLV